MDEKQKLEAEIKALIKEKEAQNKALKRFIEALTAKGSKNADLKSARSDSTRVII
jgi:hypothetical protein